MGHKGQIQANILFLNINKKLWYARKKLNNHNNSLGFGIGLNLKDGMASAFFLEK
jgi:hypothetical protein